MKIQWSSLQDFTEANVKNYVLKKAGVYRLSVKREVGSWRIFYVGITEDLLARLLEHLSSNGKDPCIENHIKKHYVGFRFAYILSSEDRKNIEYTLYHKVKPECNDKEPEGRMVDVNLDLG